MFVIHDEAYRVAGFTTAEALEDTFSRRHNKRWSLLFMKRTNPDEVSASFLKRDKLSNDLLNTSSIDDIHYSVAWYHKEKYICKDKILIKCLETKT